MSNVKKEQDNGDDSETCPPGMTKDDTGKCVASEGIHNHKKKGEEENPGETNDVGAGTIDAGDSTPDDNPHDCADGTHWDGDKCAPNAPPAGTPAGSEDPSVPGKEYMKEFYKMIEKLMASHTAYNVKQMELYRTGQQKTLESLTASMGIPSFGKESAAFGVKTEAAASSKVNDSGFKAAYEACVANPANWFEAVKKHISGTPGNFEWTVRPEAYYATLKQSWMNFGSSAAHTPIKQGVGKEAFTISGGDMPQIFSKQVYLIPGGRMRVPIRQFLDTQIITDADRFNWYKVGGFAFDDTTSEGTAPTAEAQTVTKVTGTPTITRALQVVNYADIENAPFDLIEAFNRAAALGALDAEAKEVLDTTYDAITPTNWVQGVDGAVITTDDAAGVTTMKQEGVYAAQELIMDQGGDISPGNMVLFLHPRAVKELILDTAVDFFTGQAALHATALGVLENRLGVDIVPTNKVTADTQTTTNVYRNILAMKGSIGLAVAADLQIEAQRRPDLAAVNVGARHRIDGAIIDETMTARISTEQ